MLARPVCRIAPRAARLVQTPQQSRFISASARMCQDQSSNRPNMNTSKPENKSSSSSQQGGQGSGINFTYVALGLVAVGGGYAIYKSQFAKEKLEEGKDRVAGKYMAHKASKEFEKAKEIIVNVAKEVGGKDLADKVAKMIDEARDTVQKLADNYPEAKAKMEKVAGSMAHGDAKDKLSKVAGAIGVGGIGKYISEFDNYKDALIKEAKKMGGDDVANKAGKVYEEAKSRIQKMASSIGENGIEKAAKDIDSTKEYLVKEIKKIGGDDLAKKADKLFDEAKDKIQKIASQIDDGNVISDSQYQMAKDFVVKEAEKLGGRDLAKKAGKMMDEAKEKIQKLAHEVKNQ